MITGPFPDPAPLISVIVPAYNAEATIRACLAPLLQMRRRGEVAEVIVVDDGSTDSTAADAIAAGAQVIESGGRLGPGAARNAAARIARGKILWFVDADSVAHEDAAQILTSAMAQTGVDAVFGAYDDRPPATGFWSQYKNLVHHHYHCQSNREAETFWAGCGAVRKSVFLDVDGFDAQVYTEPSIEDIELGWRLRQSGSRILLVPELQVTHLKVWRLTNLLRTEIFCRALPWSRLIQSRTGWVDTLNVSRGERLRAFVALVFLLSMPLSYVPTWVSVAALAVAIAANSALMTLFLRRRGPWFAVRGMLFHQVYYLYCSGAVFWSWLEQLWGSARARLQGKNNAESAVPACQPFAENARGRLLTAAEE
ncbi:MAG: glycosyltransferase [Xanthomonadales bacterium]|nr:glycosyltransferase [Xanthomonadales bacterium]MCB1613022.1 glycosyltransferase [Xanthomonadales bacterium]MCP5475588.1 glycosyltransferase [Rhodanobacteraceae bacterium]